MYIVPTNEGLKLRYLHWHIFVGMMSDPSGMGIGNVFGIAQESEAGWQLVYKIQGPHGPATWAQIIKDTGGMGAYWHSKLPDINWGLDYYFDPTPELPAVTNAEPYDWTKFNRVGSQYFEIKVDPTVGDQPIARFKPYVPPA